MENEKIDDLKIGDENRWLGNGRKKELDEVWGEGEVDEVVDGPVYVQRH